MKNRIFFAGFFITLVGVSLIGAVFLVPIKHHRTIRTYESRELILHNLENYDLNSSNYFVSVSIKRGRNIYTSLVANHSFNFFILPIKEWISAIMEEREYDNLFAKYLNVSKVNTYFNAPQEGYYIFEIKKTNISEGLKLNYFRIKAIYDELVENTIEADYDFNIIIWGGILIILGFSISLYMILPRAIPEGILKT
jgi:hypothetical protein